MNLRKAILAAVAAGAVVAGCGGDDDTGGDATQTRTPAAETPAAETPAGAGDGKQLFTTTCGSCHTLAAAGTSGQIGPSLDDIRPDEQRVLSAIRTGPGQMPENLLQGDDAETVASYVAENAGG